MIPHYIYNNNIMRYISRRVWQNKIQKFNTTKRWAGRRETGGRWKVCRLLCLLGRAELAELKGHCLDPGVPILDTHTCVPPGSSPRWLWAKVDTSESIHRRASAK